MTGNSITDDGPIPGRLGPLIPGSRARAAIVINGASSPVIRDCHCAITLDEGKSGIGQKVQGKEQAANYENMSAKDLH